MKSNSPITTSSDNLDNTMQDYFLSTPSASYTAYKSFEKGFLATPQGVQDVRQAYFNAPRNTDLENTMGSIDATLSNPNIGTGQGVTDWIANQVGFLSNPANILLGGLAGKAVGLGLDAAADLLPDAATSLLRKPITGLVGEDAFVPKVAEEGAKRPATIGETGRMATHAAVIPAVTMVPQEIADNYNADKNSINWGGVAKGTLMNGGIGLLLGSLPFTAGTLWKKLSKFDDDTPLPDVGSIPFDDTVSKREQEKQISENPHLNNIQEAVNAGRITDNEGKWMQEYLTNPNDKELQRRATQILSNRNIPVDHASDQVVFKMLDSQDIENLNGALADQVSSQGEVSPNFKSAMTDFVSHNRFDNIRSTRANMIDGLQAFSDFVRTKFKSKEIKLSQADDILDKHMLKSIKENMPFSQKEIFKTMKKMQFEKSHIDQLHYEIPENLKRMGDLPRTIKNLQDKIDQKTSRIKFISDKKNNIKNRAKKISEHKMALDKLKKSIKPIQDELANNQKILTPKEELLHLKDKLLSGGLKEGFENTKEYRRLKELSEVWPQAATLLDRVHLEDEYAKQSAYADVIQSITNIMKSSLPKLANPENVMNYLKQKIESNAPIPKEESNIREDSAEKENPLEDKMDDASLKDPESDVRSSGAKELKGAFNEANEKLKQFREKKSARDNLMNCLMG